MPIGCKNKEKNLKNFIERSNKLFNNKYDYSKFEWKGSNKSSIIICPIHGEFEKSPTNHLKGQGCKICKEIEKKEKDRIFHEKEFIEKAKKIHNNFYDYSKVSYTLSNINIEIICPIHGEFYQTPNIHLRGCGCPECGKKKSVESNILSTEEFIEKAKKIHGNKYDYSNTHYTGGDNPIKIICPIHGEFEIKRAKKHIDNSRKQGCKECNGIISNGENIIIDYFKKHEINFNYNKILDDNDEYLKNKPFDFILENQKIIIEFDGTQHYFKKFKMTDQDLEERKEIDKNKEKIAIKLGYKIFRIKYNENIITRLNEILSSTTIETTEYNSGKE